MQAVATKELRSRMRGARAFVVLTIYLLLLSCLVIAMYGFIRRGLSEAGAAGAMGGPPPVGRIMFYAVALVELLLIAPLAPAFTSGTIAGERERQTFDLVMTTPISARDYILGKLASSLSYILLLVFVSLPVQVLALLFGGLTISEVLIGFWMLVVAAIFYASSSIFFSAVMHSTTTAGILSYLLVAMSLIGAMFIFFVVGILGVSNIGIFGVGPDRTPPLWAVYVALFLVSLSPLTAGGLTAAALISNSGTFLVHLPMPPDGHQITLVTPWIIYSVVYLGVSALMIWGAIRRVRPTRARHPGHPARLPQEGAS